MNTFILIVILSGWTTVPVNMGEYTTEQKCQLAGMQISDQYKWSEPVNSSRGYKCFKVTK